MKVFTADLSEVLLAEHRDEGETDYLARELSQIVKDLLGTRFWISYWNYYPLLAGTLYYAVTFLSAVQTVGEEYTALLPLVSVRQHKVPVFTRRLIFILSFSVAPLLIEKILEKIEGSLKNSLTTNETLFFDRKQRNLRKTLLNSVISIRCIGIPVLHRLNLALFYLFGTYYYISKRLIGLQYVSFRAQSNYQALSYFRFFGAINIAQLVSSAAIWIRDRRRKQRSEEATAGFRQISESGISEVADELLAYNSFRCSLCWKYNKPPICIPCGHLFCWNCISKHIQFAITDRVLTFCPHCREEFHQSRVIVIMNVSAVILRKLLCGNAKWVFGKGIFRFSSLVKSKLENKYYPVIYVAGIQPTGVPHLGNYFGFIQHWINLQNDSHSKRMYLSVADYHAISMGFIDPLEMRNNILKMAASLLACGLDPEKTILFQQSRVADHANLMYILGSLQTVARLTRMPQYKDKAAVFKHGDIPVNLQLYPILQAADVLLYKGTHVPVGEDQTQHLLLMRDLAVKCNAVLHCDFFPIPVQVNARCARLKSLQNSTRKMSKSVGNDRSRILISDTKQIIAEKCAKALSDSQSNITYEPEKRPAISNLVILYALATGLTVENVIDECASLNTKEFKSCLAEKIDTLIAPFREKYESLLQEPQLVRDILMFGTQRAEEKAQETMEELRELLGFNLFHPLNSFHHYSESVTV
ncbi:tryptophanyl-tRNA synthetase [Loa loa]|uniref:tryptophan--tRNA ligase n=1 Tax=Loa loa TaxID=7209 RepID=A0A1S0UJW8_LOALO|nr:tryptophanyl-tRNA synthetase [Loa loa]EJD75990.1 tryptophanyl-tRNA synthetase [Loa loa]